jgi:HEAT repeat protein
VLEQYLGDLQARPAEEMLGEQGFRTLRWLVRRAEGCGPAFEGFLRLMADPDSKVRGAALGRGADILPDLLSMERFDLVEKLIDGLSLRLRQEIDASHYPWVLGTLERITDELRIREKHGLASRISGNLAELLMLLPEKPVAKDMVRILSKIGDDTALNTFVQALLKDPVFELVAEELAVKGEQAIPYLLGVVKESEDKTMRFKTMYVLNKIGPSVEEHIIRALADDRWFVRRNMCIMLGQVGGEASLPALGGLLEDKEPRVRIEALRAMNKIGGQACEPWAIRAVHDKDPEVKREALALLGQIGGEASVDGLCELYLKKDILGRTETNEVKRQIIAALGGIGTKSAAAFLMKVAKDRDQELAGAAVKTLQELMKKLKSQEAAKT